MEKDIEKKLKELLEKFKEEIDGKENCHLDEAKKVVMEKLDGNPRCLIFATPEGHLSTGREDEILSMLAMVINQLKEELSIEPLIYSCLAGLCLDDPKDGNFDLDMVNQILKVLKEQV